MFGKGKSEVVETPIQRQRLEPYAEVKRLGLFKWRVSFYRGEDDKASTHYNPRLYKYDDNIKYFNYHYFYLTEAKAERKAKILLAKAKDRIDWSRTVKRFDVK